MTLEISVGPPVLTINQGATFMVTDLLGEIPADGEFGVFVNDTRVVSFYRLYTNNVPWTWVTSSTTSYYAARIHLVNQSFTTETEVIPAGVLALTIIRTIGAGIHEDLEIRNYSLQSVQFDLEIALRSDFADIFEVRRHTYVRRGEVITDWRPEDAALFTSYTNRDFQRRFAYRLNNIKDPPHFANGRITIPVSIAAGDTWRACGEFLFGEED